MNQYSIRTETWLADTPDAFAIISFAREITSEISASATLDTLDPIASPARGEVGWGRSGPEASSTTHEAAPGEASNDGLTAKAFASDANLRSRGLAAPVSHFHMVTEDTPVCAARPRTESPLASRKSRRRSAKLLLISTIPAPFGPTYIRTDIKWLTTDSSRHAPRSWADSSQDSSFDALKQSAIPAHGPNEQAAAKSELPCEKRFVGRGGYVSLT